MINPGIPIAVGAFLGYAVASAFFWNFPHWLHKKKNISFTCAHISHRGGKGEFDLELLENLFGISFLLFRCVRLYSGSAEGYENTLKAFRK